MIASEPGRRVPVWWWIWLPGCLLGGAAWWMLAPSSSPRHAPGAVVAAPMAALHDATPRSVGRAEGLPVLAGVDVPAGPELDTQGHLRLTRALRTYFDYFASMQADLRGVEGGDALDVSVRDDIRRHVPAPAETQAFDLWRRYRGYLAEVRQLGADRTQVSAQAETMSTARVAQLRAQFDGRRALRQRYLPDVGAIWFGDDDAYDEAALERLAVAAQPDLDPAERQRRLDAADSKLPASVREARVAGMAPQRIGETITAMQKEGRSTQDIAAALAKDFGADVAQRYAQQAQAEQGWTDRYTDYARQRRLVEQAPGMSDVDRQQQVDQLRAQMFSDPSEALRAHVVDKAGAEAGAVR